MTISQLLDYNLEDYPMALDPRYVIAPSLEQYYVDKTTGLPLAQGTVEFFSDVNRSTHKAIYTLSGTAPNYTYVQLPNPSTLSGVGTFDDGNGNDVIPYYYPYDADGNVELYYIVVKSSDDTEQFTREGWPNIVASSAEEESTLTNYIPNGQFLMHNNIPADPLNDTAFGQITMNTTPIAPGGWTFNRPNASTSLNFVTFPAYGEYIDDPSSSPRYALRVSCTNASPADTFKDVRLLFGDVNKFASTTQEYTFAFNGITSSSSNFTVAIVLIKNFGTGGSPSAQTTTTLAQFTITSTETLFQFPFVFGTNESKVLGTNNDDYVAIGLRFPTNVTFGGLFVDFMLFQGDINVTAFPQTTDKDFIARSMVPPIPDPNGFDIGLPLICTPSGLDYDNSQVGNVYASIKALPDLGELPCDGSIYRSAAYSTDDIPYRRLQRKLITTPTPNPTNTPAFGTGANFLTASYLSSTNTWLMLSTNKAGAQTATSDGADPTGFTFFGTATGRGAFGFLSFVYGAADTLWIICTANGVVTDDVGPGTSGFTMNTFPDPSIGERIGTAQTYQIMSLDIAVQATASTYFNIATPAGQYYVWFRVDGTGTDPAPGGTGILVDVGSNFSRLDTAYAIAEALSGHQVSYLQVVAGSAVPASSYFNIFANSQRYYVWYNLNGTGNDPNIANAIAIPVIYQTTDSNNDIRNNTVAAINDTYFATPNLEGVVIKGAATTVLQDANIAYRYTTGSRYILPSALGTYQFDTILSHTHSSTGYLAVGPDEQVQLEPANYSAPLTPDTYININNTGTAQNDVKNVYLNYYIKY